MIVSFKNTQSKGLIKSPIEIYATTKSRINSSLHVLIFTQNIVIKESEAIIQLVFQTDKKCEVA